MRACTVAVVVSEPVRITVKVAVAVDSGSCRSANASVKPRAESSSTMVTRTADVVPIRPVRAPLVTLVICSRRLSGPSAVVSAVAATWIVWVVTPGAKTIVAGAGGVSVKSDAAAESSVTVTTAVAVSVSAPVRVNVRVVLVPSATLAVAAANATLAALPSSARISATLGDSSWITRSRTVLSAP